MLWNCAHPKRTLQWVGSPRWPWRGGSLGGVDRRRGDGSRSRSVRRRRCGSFATALKGPIVAHIRCTVASSPIVFAHRRLADARHRLDSPPRHAHRARLHYICPCTARVRGRLAPVCVALRLADWHRASARLRSAQSHARRAHLLYISIFTALVAVVQRSTAEGQSERLKGTVRGVFSEFRKYSLRG